MDRELFRRAGISPVPNRPTVHFFSAKLESQLARIELLATHEANRRLSHVRRTWFGIVADGKRFEFRVLKQKFRD